MEVGEWQHEVRQGVRRMVVRREQGAVGSVSRGEWGKSDECDVITAWNFLGKKNKNKMGRKRGKAAGCYIGSVSVPTLLRLAINRHGC